MSADHTVHSQQSLWEAQRTVEVTLTRRYLNFPVKLGVGMTRLAVAIEGGPIREFDIELAPDEPDFWVFMDVAQFRGRRATIGAPLGETKMRLLAAIANEDAIRGAEDLYQERYRPQFHFSSRRGWNNDPNGLVWHAGEYHLFYQHNPYGWGWGNMHWGHAVSPDLVHWTELSIAIYPDQHGTAFSGSAVVDKQNTAGLATGREAPLVCLYTAAGDPVTQCLAYSNDKGRTWQTFEGNPVLPHIIGSNRDPKVIWYEPQRKWIMALYLDGNDFALFSSTDLKQWERMSGVTIEGCSECPEFFPIALDGDEAKVRWVFYGGNGRYLVGDFDGKTFRPESGPHTMHHGNAFYASQTYNNVPDGRRIVVGWGQVEMPGMPFNQMMTFPTELTLRTTPEGPRLFAAPVGEVANLYAKTHRFDAGLPAAKNPLAGLQGDLWDIEAEFDLQDATQVGFFVRGIPVTYHVGGQRLSCLDRSGEVVATDGKLKLRLLADRTSIEIFAGDGGLYMPMGVIPSDELHGLEVFARGGKARVSLEVRELKSAWGE